MYETWGQHSGAHGSLAATLGALNPFRYRGYYYDQESGLYYLNSRYYDPETCRFINADGYADTATGIHSQNMFIYCLHNPVRYIDSSGEAIVIDDIIIIALVCVIAFSAASSVAVAGQSTLAMPAPKLPDPWDWPQQPERKVIPFPNSKLQVIPSPDNNKSEKTSRCPAASRPKSEKRGSAKGKLFSRQ